MTPAPEAAGAREHTTSPSLFGTRRDLLASLTIGLFWMLVYNANGRATLLAAGLNGATSGGIAEPPVWFGGEGAHDGAVGHGRRQLQVGFAAE